MAAGNFLKFFEKLSLISLLLFFCSAKCQELEGWEFSIPIANNQAFSMRVGINLKTSLARFETQLVAGSNETIKYWIGVGLSPNAGMQGGDLFIAWGEGETEFGDYHAKENGRPILDEGDDDIWTIEYFKSNDTVTAMATERPFAVKDNEEDVAITDSPLYLLWAYGLVDPENGITYHGSTRGYYRINLLQKPGSQTGGANKNNFNMGMGILIFNVFFILINNFIFKV